MKYRQEVQQKLKSKMVMAFNTVYTSIEETDMRTAALTLAVDKVAKSLDSLGLWP